ncbi:MAG: hypothetical protein Q8N70_01775, partial [Deltaproteobacteria bacterium]|nr:hypothetical protein [Deltaproteobacteria bacterium]
ELDGRDFQATYSGNADAQKARDFLATVTWNSVTIPTQAETRAYIKDNIADPGDPILSQPTQASTTDDSGQATFLTSQGCTRYLFMS